MELTGSNEALFASSMGDNPSSGAPNMMDGMMPARLRSLEGALNDSDASNARFAKGGKDSTSFLVNVGPILFVYMIFGTILGVKAFIYKFVEKVKKSKNRLAVWVDNNINHTLMTLVFYLTFQDEILIVFMQFNDARFDTGIDVFSFILALVALVHMFVMLGYILYFILKDMSNEDRARKCGAFFAGLKDSDPAKNLHVNARLVSLVVFSKMIQKAILVIVIVYAKTANEILPMLILCCFVLMGELTIQPYKSIIVFIVTFLLSLFQFLLICMTYLIKDAETKD